MTELRLVVPGRRLLQGYEAALAAGWSPNTTRDVAPEQLAMLRRDPAGFLRELLRQEGTVRLADGRLVPRLPFRLFWLDDGAFCGAINLRFQPGSEDLPPYVSGHIGYAVVPWKQRRGYATRALGLILPVAHRLGLRRVLVTCDNDNLASQQVIRANGGIAAGARREDDGKEKLLFWVATTSFGNSTPLRTSPSPA